MNKHYLLCLLLSWLCTTSAFSNNKFPEGGDDFVRELGTYMKQGKRPQAIDAFNRFQKYYESKKIESKQLDQIRGACDQMRALKLSAHPYFTNYFEALLLLSEKQAEHFDQWQSVLSEMLTNLERKDFKKFKKYLNVCKPFFEQNALQFSERGISWLALEGSYEFLYEDNQPIIRYTTLDLQVVRKNNELTIKKTSGTFYPLQNKWIGKGGQVYWPQKGMDEVYAELLDVEINLNKSFFQATNAQLHYPAIFADQKMEGKLEYKLKQGTSPKEGTYPRFESASKKMIIPSIGEHLKYIGGVKLWGNKIYGYGTADEKAIIQRVDENGELKFLARADHFVIQPNLQFSGEQVEIVLKVFGQDSICHPSVNAHYHIPSSALQLSRGKRGSDRNPFFDTYHQVNIESDKINWYIDQDSLMINEKKKEIGNGNPTVTLESAAYFDVQEYRKLQNVANYHPVASLKGLSGKNKSKTIDAMEYAKVLNSRFDVTSIQSLLYELVAGGFITYDKDNQKIHLQPKVFHSVDASAEKIDYDNLRLVSISDETNIEVRRDNDDLLVNDVKVLEFSNKQKVALKPHGNQVALQKNRDMEFAGKLYAGLSLFDGKSFHFHYDPFEIKMDSIRFLDLFIEQARKDERGEQLGLSIGSRLEHLQGVLLIDAPANKSGREDIDMFPAFVSKAPSYVYYDLANTKDTCYSRDSFYFEVAPFSFEHLDRIEETDIQFKGKMYSAGIFPVFEETLKVQSEDTSLGFMTKTKEEGYELFGGKGLYKGDIGLNNQGMKGKGNVQYLWASIDSEDFLFRPDQLLGSAKEFSLEEDRTGEIEVPQVKGRTVDINWRPYQDSMFIQSKDKSFDVFKKAEYHVDGQMILTPDGLKSRGTFHWESGQVDAALMSFGAYSIYSDTCDLQVKIKDLDHLALNTKNVYSRLDFDSKIGTVAANADTINTVLPYNEYQTSLNEFDWDMKNENITFRSRDGKLGHFLSLVKEQEGLNFMGKTAFYDLKTNELKIGGVDKIISADAFIYPDSGLVEIRPGGLIPTLVNARIVADTVNQYHVINRAKVSLKGRNEYVASGFYEYNIGKHEQEVEFANIRGARYGKGKKSNRPVMTKAKGEVGARDKFYIDHRTNFFGTIQLNAASKNLNFDGFAKLDIDILEDREWFTMACEADKKNLTIVFNEPKNEKGYELKTGYFLSKETAGFYPRVLQPLRYAKDRPVFEASGLIKYDESKDQFLLGDSLKIVSNVKYGNLMRLDASSGEVEMEGRFHLGSGMPEVKITSAGRTKINLNGPKPPRIQCMSGWEFILPKKLLDILSNDIHSSIFDARLIDYKREKDFYKKALSEFIPDSKALHHTIAQLPGHGLEMPEKMNPYTILFSQLELEWKEHLQSFVSIRPQIGVASIDGKTINRFLDAKMEVRMPSNDEDRFYLYIKSPSDYYYYFAYQNGVLSTASNNEQYNVAVNKLGKKDRMKKLKNGATYEIQLVETTVAQQFLRRLENN